MTLRAGGLTIVVLIVARVACAQGAPAPDTAAEASGTASQNSWFLRVGYSPAHVLAASPFGAGANEARALTVELGRQTNGTSDWHRVYNYPSYGVGLYVGRFDHERELGRPLATYGFFSWPFPVSRRAQVTADVGIGVSWNWTPFDAATNPTNTALGSAVAYHIHSGVSLRFLAPERASGYAGLNITHWSHRATSPPNPR